MNFWLMLQVIYRDTSSHISHCKSVTASPMQRWLYEQPTNAPFHNIGAVAKTDGISRAGVDQFEREQALSSNSSTKAVAGSSTGDRAGSTGTG